MKILKTICFFFLFTHLFANTPNDFSKKATHVQSIQLKFIIDEDFILKYFLSYPTRRLEISDSKYTMDLLALKTLVKEKSSIKEYAYLKLLEMYRFNSPEIDQTVISDFITNFKNEELFQKVLQQTIVYKKNCEEQWINNYDKTHQIMNYLTGIDFYKELEIFIMHPGLASGYYNKKNNYIVWSSEERFSNYTTIYLWHEIMHSYLECDNITHSIIELLTDAELNKQLNGNNYPPFIGHSYLEGIEEYIYPYWIEYINSENRNIFEFCKQMQNEFE